MKKVHGTVNINPKIKWYLSVPLNQRILYNPNSVKRWNQTNNQLHRPQDVDPYEDGVLGDDWDFDDDYQNVTTQVSKTLRNQRNRWWSLSITTLFTKPNQYAKNPYLQYGKSINTMVQPELIPLNHDGTEKSMLDKITLQLSPPNLLNWQRSNSVEV